MPTFIYPFCMMSNRDYKSSYPSYPVREEINRRPKSYIPSSDGDAYVPNSFDTQDRTRLARKASFVSTSSDDESDSRSKTVYESKSGYNSRADSNIRPTNRLPPRPEPKMYQLTQPRSAKEGTKWTGKGIDPDEYYYSGSIDPRNETGSVRKHSFTSTVSDNESDWESENYNNSKSGYHPHTGVNRRSENRLHQIQDDSHSSALWGSAKAKGKKPREVPKKQRELSIYSNVQQLEAEKKEEKHRAAYEAEMNRRKSENAKRINNLSIKEHDQMTGRRNNDVRSNKKTPPLMIFPNTFFYSC